MIESILHLLGICPDSFSHYDAIDFIVCNFNELKSLFWRAR